MTQTIFKRVFYLSLTLLISAFAAVAVFAAGEVDTTFDASVQSPINGGTIFKIVAQPDGKILVAGYFSVAGNAPRTSIARLNADGTNDNTFTPPDFYRTFNGTLPEAYIYAVALQSDGKIVVGGLFDQVAGSSQKGAVRLNTDGSLDNSFDPTFESLSNPSSSSQIIYDIKIQPDNRILLSGQFAIYGGVAPGLSLHNNLARFNPNGSIDESFIPPSINTVKTFVLQPDGKVVYADLVNNEVRRLNSDGSGDSSFLASVLSSVNKLALQASGKIIVARETSNSGLLRLNANGVVDSTFNPSGVGPVQGAVRDIVILPNDKITISGTFVYYNSIMLKFVARLNSDGTLDNGFFYSGEEIFYVNAIALLNDGSYVLGILRDDLRLGVNNVVHISATGVRDTNFIGNVSGRGSVYRVITQSDGKVLIAGLFTRVNGVVRQNVARLNTDGSIDTTFNSVLNFNSVADIFYTVASQTDGKVLVGGLFTFRDGGFQNQRISVARFNTNGTVDTTFVSSVQNGGIINEIIPLADGKILIAGKFRLSQYNFDLNVARLNANGSTDSSFIVQQVNTTGIVRAMKLQPDGKIVVGGNFTQIAGANRGSIARLNTDGIVDTTFNPFSGVNGNVFDLAIQSNGNITIGGDFSSVNGVANHYYLAQLFPDGSLNAPFNTVINNFVYAVERQADDKILVGSFFNISGKRGIGRFNQDGSFDNSFTGNGTNDIVRDIFIQSDNKILIGGDFTRVNNVSRVSVARLLNVTTTPRTPYDFDGDGKADLAVFRPSNGVWYLQQSTNGFVGISFGMSGDILTPADYDGDGKTDIAVFRPSNGTWYLQRSQLGFTGIQFGDANDIPVPADYDGDGKADIAVFRPSTGVWYTSTNPATNYGAVTFGVSGDKPVPADYDGDGKADLAVFRPSNGVWYIQRSQLGFTGIAFGDGNDKPVPADYDGDGKADIALFRPSTGYWYTSTNPAINYGAVLFGANGDLPVPADYDGDGKADLAVFRPSNGVWYLQRSTQGFTGILFGVNEDKPIPNAYIR